MNSSIKIGLVGCGHWGKNILRDLKTLQCTVWTVARSKQSQANAQQYGSDYAVTQLENLPNFLDGFIVATPPTTHAQITEALLARQKPIFVEKPLTVDVESAWRLARLGEGLVFVMDKWRYHAGIEALAEFVATQKLGKPLALHTTRQQWQHRSLDVDEVWHLATHDLSIILHILGAHGTPVAALPEWGHEGRLMGICGFLDVHGIAATLAVSCRRLQTSRAVELQCEQGVALLHDSYADHILIAPDAKDAQPQKYPIDNQLPLLKELKAFVNHLQGGDMPLSSVIEAATSVEKLHKLRELARNSFPFPTY